MHDWDIKNHFWPTLYACKYIGLGIFAFALPTRAWHELAIRMFFIILGVSVLLTINRPKITIMLISLGAIILTFWILFAGTLVIMMWPNLYARLLIFTMPFWLGWAAGHFWVVRDLTDER